MCIFLLPQKSQRRLNITKKTSHQDEDLTDLKIVCQQNDLANAVLRHSSSSEVREETAERDQLEASAVVTRQRRQPTVAMPNNNPGGDKSKNRKTRLLPTLQGTAKSDFNELDLHAKDIIHEQNCDTFCKPIVQFLVNGELPHNRKEARAVISWQEDYVILNDILYHIFTPFGSKLSGSTAQLVVPKSLISTVLSYHHDTTHSGHLGI